MTKREELATIDLDALAEVDGGARPFAFRQCLSPRWGGFMAFPMWPPPANDWPPPAYGWPRPVMVARQPAIRGPELAIGGKSWGVRFSLFGLG